MKYKYILTVFSLILSASIFSAVYAENSQISLSDGNSLNDDIQTNLINNKNDRATSSEKEATSTKIRNATSTEAKNNNDQASTTESNQDQLMSDEHRSTVAIFVRSLLAVADREGGIGAQVREIAKAQNDSTTTTDSAIAKVEDRSSFRTFFFGSDYKDLGIIRSEIIKTSNNIAKLKNLLASTTSATNQTELGAQIKVLEAEQIKLNAYVTTHENYFSLFGWAIRPFTE